MAYFKAPHSKSLKIDLKQTKSQYFPALLLKPDNLEGKSSHIFVYFHANAEDLNSSYPMLDYLRRALDIWVLAMEYPGYGIYEGEASESQVLEDANNLMEWLSRDVLGSNKEGEQHIYNQLIICGRSLGSGVAAYIADKYPVCCLVLISPFTSIKDVAKNLFGSLGSVLVKQRFDNLKRISEVQCPTLFIHGKKDDVIPPEHSESLYSKLWSFIFSYLRCSKVSLPPCATGKHDPQPNILSIASRRADV